MIGPWELTPKKAFIRTGDNAITVTITAETEVKVRFVPGKTYTVEGVSFTMKDIAAVTNGTVGHHNEWDNKPHTVSLTAYRIGESEVTQELWKKVMGNNPSRFKYGLKHPVEGISWYHAIAFCNKLSLKLGLTPCYTVTVLGSPIDFETLAFSEIPAWSNKNWDNTVLDMSKNGFRLPTEAEWEWAAKGGTEDKWAGTNEENELGYYAWYDQYPGSDCHRSVKLKAANGYGLYDMSGNVWEWCWDWYDWSTPAGGKTDPTGAASGPNRVYRGGQWFGGADRAARAYRSYVSPAYSDGGLGFRLVCRP